MAATCGPRPARACRGVRPGDAQRRTSGLGGLPDLRPGPGGLGAKGAWANATPVGARALWLVAELGPEENHRGKRCGGTLRTAEVCTVAVCLCIYIICIWRMRGSTTLTYITASSLTTRGAYRKGRCEQAVVPRGGGLFGPTSHPTSGKWSAPAAAIARAFWPVFLRTLLLPFLSPALCMVVLPFVLGPLAFSSPSLLVRSGAAFSASSSVPVERIRSRCAFALTDFRLQRAQHLHCQHASTRGATPLH
jgi:hypothetical protein